MSLRVVSLGDSTSCGEGVGLSVDPALTWPARLAAALPGGELLPLATAGARVRDVRARQLDAAVEARPHLATLLIGLNDVSRGGFCPDAVGADLRAVVHELRLCGATLLIGRLHDPCRHLPLPPSLCAAVRRRVAVVNAAVDAAAAAASRDGAGGDVHVLDLARMPALRLRRAWAVDRVHPHGEAHGLIAAEAARVLTGAGLPVDRVHAAGLPQHAPGVAQEVWWTARHGLPWLAAHARDVVLPAVRLAG